MHKHTHKHTHRPLLQSLLLAVAEEGSELSGVGVVVERNQEVLVELEGGGHLHHHLPHALQELGEDGAGFLLLHHHMATPGQTERRHSILLAAVDHSSPAHWVSIPNLWVNLCPQESHSFSINICINEREDCTVNTHITAVHSPP